tara:strand:- start:3867 stop:5618 length:1752 start_codon:yes stop_codon:yes gene_type:complete
MASIYDIARIQSGDPMQRARSEAADASALLAQYKKQKGIVDDINEAIADAEKKAGKNKEGYGIAGSLLGGLIGGGLTMATGGLGATALTPYMGTLGAALGSGVAEKYRQDRTGATNKLKKLEERLKGTKQGKQVKDIREGMDENLDEMLTSGMLNAATMDLVMPAITKAGKNIINPEAAKAFEEAGIDPGILDESLDVGTQINISPDADLEQLKNLGLDVSLDVDNIGQSYAPVEGTFSEDIVGESIDISDADRALMEEAGFTDVTGSVYGGDGVSLDGVQYAKDAVTRMPDPIEGSYLTGVATEGKYAGQQFNITNEGAVKFIDPKTGRLDYNLVKADALKNLEAAGIHGDTMGLSPDYEFALQNAINRHPRYFAHDLKMGYGSPETFYNVMYPDFALPGGAGTTGTPNPFTLQNYAQFQSPEVLSPAQILTSDPSALASAPGVDVGALPFPTERTWVETGGTLSEAGYTDPTAYTGTGTLQSGFETPQVYDPATTNIFGMNVPISDAAAENFAKKASYGQNIIKGTQLGKLIPEGLLNNKLFQNPMINNLLKVLGPQLMRPSMPKVGRLEGPTFRNPYGGF